MNPLDYLRAIPECDLFASERDRSQIMTKQENPNMATPGMAGLAFWGGAALVAAAEELGRAIR